MQPVSATASEPVASPPIVNAPIPANRIASVDVYRGFVMLLMMAEILAFKNVSRALPDSAFWSFMTLMQTHVPWVGCTLHDLIQPSFTFLVGVVLPYSMASRAAKGGTFGTLLKHVIVRSLILIFLGIFLRSLYSEQTYFTFEDTLTQIGLGYTFLFLLGYCSTRIQIAALAIILTGYWLIFALYPLPDGGFDYDAAGVKSYWEHNLEGFAAHWNKNTNAAWAFDRWFLNLFPRESTFLYNSGGYATLSFIPTLGTMILGLFAGKILRSSSISGEKIRLFVIIGISLVASGLLFHVTGINPVVKRIWTPAWTLFSGGMCFLLLTFFYAVIDVKDQKRWAFFLLIIGVNSIAAYVIADGFAPFIAKSLYIHLGQNFDRVFGAPYASLVKGGLVLLVEWLILYWMYKKKIFIKV